jgi:hypothetical protein
METMNDDETMSLGSVTIGDDNSVTIELNG